MVLTACGFHATSSNQTPGDDDSGSGRVDASGGGGDDDAGKPPPDAQQCFGVGLLANLCLDAAPTGDRTFAAMSFDTGGSGCTKVIAQTGDPELCVVAGKTITVTGAFVATGSRALVMIAADTLIVQAGGSIDASSRTSNGPRKGAAANTGTCSSLNRGGSDSGGGGGGAGGSFGTVGGNGGSGDGNDNGSPKNGASPGAAVGMAQATPTILRGGCPGSAGGDGSANVNNAGGPAGDGGGAVYLIAVNTITVAGDVFASGGGGGARAGGTGQEEGGGGGGAGGMIGLDARTINVTGHVVANGGGGGGGGTTDRGGTAGGDGTTTTWNVRANGGSGGSTGSMTAGGGAKGTTVGVTSMFDGDNSTGGAGGAAGGLGVIWTWGALTGTMISPTPVTH
jgi:hypothetical protein